MYYQELPLNFSEFRMRLNGKMIMRKEVIFHLLHELKYLLAGSMSSFFENRIELKCLLLLFQTPLHQAVWMGKENVVEILVKNGAKINEKNVRILTQGCIFVFSQRVMFIFRMQFVLPLCHIFSSNCFNMSFWILFDTLIFY